MNLSRLDSRHELNEPSVIGETIDSEVMVIDLDTGVYYSMAGAGAIVWPWLIAGATPFEIAMAGTADAGNHQNNPGSTMGTADLASRIAAFAKHLCNEGILRPRPVLAPPDLTALGVLPHMAAAAEFKCERFDDMQAMLLADPVHDVGDRGWPDVTGAREK